MAIIGIIFLGLFVFVVLGGLGWILKGIAFVMSLLGSGVQTFFGCIFRLIIGILFLIALFSVI